jgi:hypothetical protein
MQPNPPTPHQCGHRCQVEALFGNAYRCVTSGLVHICDRNCDQRVPYDRYSTICVVSKRLGPPVGGGLGGAADGMTMGVDDTNGARKRSVGGEDDVAFGGLAGNGDAAAMLQAQMMQQQHQQQHQEHLMMLQRQGSSKRGRVSGENDAAFVAAP